MLTFFWFGILSSTLWYRPLKLDKWNSRLFTFSLSYRSDAIRYWSYHSYVVAICSKNISFLTATVRWNRRFCRVFTWTVTVWAHISFSSNFFAIEYDTFRLDARCQLISIDRINYLSLIIFVIMWYCLFFFQKSKHSLREFIFRYDCSLHLFNATRLQGMSHSFIWTTKSFVIDIWLYHCYYVYVL